MTRRAIVVFPKFEELHLIQQLRMQYDPLAHDIQPHITLVFPFESNISPEHLRAHIRQAVQGIGSFPVQLHGITGSEGEYLFLNVKRGSDPLIDLHDRLYSGPLAEHLSVEHTFIPHITVGRIRDRKAFLRALVEVQKLRTVFRTSVEEVAVCGVGDQYPIEFVVRL